MSQIRRLILCLTLVCFQSVLAQPSIAESPKSKSTALTWSVGCILAPAAISITIFAQGEENSATYDAVGVILVSLGLWCGPGAGHLYARNNRAFVKGMIIRGLAGGLTIYSLTTIDIFDEGGQPGEFFFLAGSTLFLGSMIYDIATTGSSVDKYNHQHGFTSTKLQPRYFVRRKTIGLGLSVRF